MHEWGDSGITAVLWAIGLAVFLSLFLAQQARTRAVRYKEIRRLQSVAAEEARREEEEAHTEYNSMVARGNFCAVCFNPTTTRCSRCKAVRYCSSTCQVKHWKDGHKQECRAPDPIPSSGSSSNGSRNFSDVFSNNGSPSSGGSGTLSEVSEVHRVEADAKPAELARTDDTPEANGNGTLLKPKKVLFPYDYFVNFFNTEKLKVPPCGLVNCGNSCFANVVLQCLTYTRPLTAYLLSGIHREECRRSEWCFMCELQVHVGRVRQNQNPFSPFGILSRIRNIGNHLGYGRQEDAHEFMRFAIDSMQSICLDEAGGEKAVDPRSQETTLIHYIFGGHFQSQVKCMQCLHESNRYENMMDLAVEIHGCVETLEDALTQFTAPEWLDGENKYKCDRCNAYVKARKRLTMHEAPNILTIALKRFQSGKFGKLNKRVTFPEVLDVAPYMSGKGDVPPLYRLYGVVVHVDMLNASFFGHYICYVKDSQGLWYKIDDSKVKEVDIEKVMAQRAYMLFYSRSSARPQPHLHGVVPIPYAVTEAVDMERISSDRNGGMKVFPASPYVGSEEVVEGGGSGGLHVMVDFNELLDNYVEYNSETVKEQRMLSNGDVAAIHPSTWETERFRSVTSNNDEIETEDVACIASTSSLTETSPYMSSFTSNQGVWIPTQGFVQCQTPDSGFGDGTGFAAWDPKSSLHDDFSEVSLQPCAVEMAEKPCNNPKIGKRRLEDGLSPLPTPKPLDTDQLPAWPAGSQGRSNSCLPLVQHLSSPGPTNCCIPDELHPSLQKYAPVTPLECPHSSTSPLQQRVSSDLVFLPPLGESNVELEMADDGEMEITERSEMEEMSVPAKRQHVETETRMDLAVRIERPDEILLQAVEDSTSSDVGGSDMDWDATSQHPGSLPSGAIWGPFPDPNGADSSAETTIKSSSLGQEEALSWQQAALQSSVSSGSGLPDWAIDRESVEVHELEKSRQVTDVTMESPEASQLGVSLPPRVGWQEEVLEAAACRPDVKESSQFVDQDTTNYDAVKNPAKEPVLSTPATTIHAVNDPVPCSNGPVLHVADTPKKVGKGKSVPKPLFSPGFLNKARSPQGPKSKSSMNTSSKLVPVENGHIKQVQEGETSVAESVPASDQKCSSNGESHAEENVAANDQECSSSGESHAKNHVGAIIPAVDELRPTAEETPLAALNNDVSAAANGEVPSCGDCMNCDASNSVHSGKKLESSAHVDSKLERSAHMDSKLESSAHMDSKLENGHQNGQKVGSKAPESNDTHIVKNKLKNDPGASSSTSARPNNGVNGNGSSLQSSRRVNNNDEKPGVEPVSEAGTAVSSRPGANGKQKQGRNETCNCGSQRKWKKCCGKTGAMKPEGQTPRRLIV